MERDDRRTQALYVLFHDPGRNWIDDVGFRDQPGVRAHVAYMKSRQEEGILVLGGPFLDDSGGMMVLKAESITEALSIAESDPTVRSGLLSVRVKAWMPMMGSIVPTE